MLELPQHPALYRVLYCREDGGPQEEVNKVKEDEQEDPPGRRHHTRKSPVLLRSICQISKYSKKQNFYEEKWLDDVVISLHRIMVRTQHTTLSRGLNCKVVQILKVWGCETELEISDLTVTVRTGQSSVSPRGHVTRHTWHVTIYLVTWRVS